MFPPRSSGSWPSCGCYFTHRNPTPKNIVQDRVEPLRASSAPSNLIFFRHMPHRGVPLQIWDTREARWCHRGGCARSAGAFLTADGLCQGASAAVPGFSKRSFYVLAARGKRYSLQLSDGSGAEADASISSPPSVNNTPSLYCVERMTAFSVSCASPRLAV